MVYTHKTKQVRVNTSPTTPKKKVITKATTSKQKKKLGKEQINVGEPSETAYEHLLKQVEANKAK